MSVCRKSVTEAGFSLSAKGGVTATVAPGNPRQGFKMEKLVYVCSGRTKLNPYRPKTYATAGRFS